MPVPLSKALSKQLGQIGQTARTRTNTGPLLLLSKLPPCLIDSDARHGQACLGRMTRQA